MKLLRYLSSVFVDVFGITHPWAASRDRAARYIGFLLFAMLATLLLLFLLTARVLSQ